ncbi:DUF4188 domain-containing protein [Alkalicoccobacillus gibsonii]|uniref:DUF4188 domain-containing protein n=1 Tax=Alkalicoccobacillus gibsonii TaxID=79881 RepID=A0ABU9VDX3_9BACI
MNIHKGRMKPNTDQPITIFVIGIKITKLWAVHKWFKTFMSMGPMLTELSQHKQQLGFYHSEFNLTWRGVTLIQYWKSEEALMNYSRSPKHLQAWKHFNQRVAADYSIGIFHEAYNVPAHQYHSIFVNMPEIGLVKAQR